MWEVGVGRVYAGKMGTTVTAGQLKKGRIRYKRVKRLTSEVPGPLKGQGHFEERWKSLDNDALGPILYCDLHLRLPSGFCDPHTYSVYSGLPHGLWILSCTDQPLALVIGWVNLSYQLLPVSGPLRISE